MVFAGHVVESDYVQIDVADTGIGIDAGTASRAFEPFFTTKPFGQGSGLGLSMVYGFVKQSGGHIHLASQVGKGTCVSFLLPRAEWVAQLDGTPDDRPRRHGGGKLVLLVEDSDAVRLVVRRESRLELGYHVIEARDGTEAEGLLQAVSDIGVLVSDVVMPGGMTGRALALVARQVRPDIRIVLISGFEHAEDGAEPLAGVALLRKPFEREQLRLAIQG